VNRVGRVNFNPGIKHVLLLKPIYINTSDLLIYHNTKARSPLADVHPYYNNLLIPHTSVLDSELHTTHRSHHVGRISLGRQRPQQSCQIRGPVRIRDHFRMLGALAERYTILQMRRDYLLTSQQISNGS
jgi:hypothetical protein